MNLVVINHHASVSEAWLLAQGTNIASGGLKGRVYEVSLADLQNKNDAEAVQEIQAGLRGYPGGNRPCI
jgi:hypothetical protein